MEVDNNKEDVQNDENAQSEEDVSDDKVDEEEKEVDDDEGAEEGNEDDEEEDTDKKPQIDVLEDDIKLADEPFVLFEDNFERVYLSEFKANEDNKVLLEELNSIITTSSPKNDIEKSRMNTMLESIDAIVTKKHFKDSVIYNNPSDPEEFKCHQWTKQARTAVHTAVETFIAEIFRDGNTIRLHSLPYRQTQSVGQFVSAATIHLNRNRTSNVNEFNKNIRREVGRTLRNERKKRSDRVKKLIEKGLDPKNFITKGKGSKPKSTRRSKTKEIKDEDSEDENEDQQVDVEKKVVDKKKQSDDEGHNSNNNKKRKLAVDF